MGHTTVASMPPAMHPADMASSGLFFCLVDMVNPISKHQCHPRGVFIVFAINAVFKEKLQL